VGESGCGKSTLLRLIAGLEVPDSGSIRIAGRTMSGGGSWVPPERRGVGMVFQDFALFPHLRAVDNVAYGLTALPRRQRRARSEELLDLVGLDGYGARFPTSCPVASSSAWPWPGRWPRSLACFYWTSRSAIWTPP
jgi:iron(III) transport system ATP-binding protein